MPTEEEKRKHRCCFTGHRPEKLKASAEEVKEWLERKIDEALRDGFTTFICGMAMGVDLWAGEIVLEKAEKNPEIHLIAVTPWSGFPARWSEEWKEQYNSVWKKAHYQKTIGKGYRATIFQERNEWMVDHSELVIAYYNGEKGGTRNTIEYAQGKGIKVILPPEEAL